MITPPVQKDSPARAGVNVTRRHSRAGEFLRAHPGLTLNTEGARLSLGGFGVKTINRAAHFASQRRWAFICD
jgi:hypothetical protein